MNRRTAIRKAIGIGAGLAAVPVLATVAKANDSLVTNSACGVQTGCSTPAYVPSPPDTRTPEQIIEDQYKEEVIDVIRHLTHEPYLGQRRYAYSVWHQTYVRTLTALREQALPFEARLIDDVPCLIGTNGNIARMIISALPFATLGSRASVEQAHTLGLIQ